MPLKITEGHQRIDRGTIVRPMSPFGTYWSDSVLMSGAAYVVKNDLVFTACHFDQNKHDRDFFSEHDEPLLEEIRLLASLALPIGDDSGYLAQYPDQISFRLPELLRLDDPQIIAEIENLLRTFLLFDHRRIATSPPLPPAPYNFFRHQLPRIIHRRIYDAISISDHLAIRGLATLLKAAMLNYHPQFAEEANYPLWISLDASYAIILNALRVSGIANPSAVDAQNFIDDAFDEERSGAKYFEEFYYNRIVTIHPHNRFGVFPYSPMSHCDFYWLHNALREIYRFLLIETVVDPQMTGDQTVVLSNATSLHDGD